MKRLSRAVPGLAALAVLLSGLVASAFTDAAPVPPQAIEAGTASASPSLEPDANTRKSEPAAALPPQRGGVQIRLDDGRYLGFHQDSPDNLRSSDRVRAEIDRLRLERRAQRSDSYEIP